MAKKLRSSLLFLLALVFLICSTIVTNSPLVNAVMPTYDGGGACNVGDTEVRTGYSEQEVTNQFAVYWLTTDQAVVDWIDNRTMSSSYRTDYSIEGVCTGGDTTLYFQLFPRSDNALRWDGVAYNTDGNISAISFTFNSSYSSFSVSVLAQSQTAVDINQSSTRNGYVSYPYGVNSSLSPGNNFTTSDLYGTEQGGVLDQYRGGSTGGGNPGNPTPPSNCSPQPLCRASISAEFVDGATIRINSIRFNTADANLYNNITTQMNFFDNDIYDSGDEYGLLGQKICTAGNTGSDRIIFSGGTFISALGANAQATLRLSFPRRDGSSCEQMDASIFISNPFYIPGIALPNGSTQGGVRNSAIGFRKTAGDTIVRVDGEVTGEHTFRLNTGQALDSSLPADVFVRTDGNEACKDYLQPRTGLSTNESGRGYTYFMNRAAVVGGCGAGTGGNSVWVLCSGASCDAVSGVVGADPDAPGDPGSDDPAAVVVEPSCESENTEGFEFIFCGLISMADKTMSKLQQQIDSVLDIRADEYANQGYRDAWAIIARISTSLLVLVALVMVFSTALSFGPFDAYTIRKILPKLVIAVIFMQLSWFLCTTFIELISSVGRGVEAILVAPFATGRSSITDLGDLLFNISSNDDSQSLFALAAYGGTVGGAVAAGGAILGIFTLLIFVLGAAISMIIGFFVLLMRKVIIIAMLIFAPIAILCWILPNTDKVYKMWWGTFSKLLYMYPIIIAFLTIGKIFAWTASGVEAGDSATFIDAALSSVSTFALVIIGYFAPFFLIPLTYKFAGGVFNQLTGMVNNKSKGLVDRPKKWLGDRKGTRRQEKVGEAASRLAEARRRGEVGSFRDRFRAAQFDPTLSAAGKRRKRAGFIAAGMAEDKKATEEIFQDAAFSTWSSSEQDEAFAAIASGASHFTTKTGRTIDLTSLTSGQRRQAQKQALNNLAQTQKWQVLRDIQGSVDRGLWNEMTQDHYGNLKAKAGDLIGQKPSDYSAPDLAAQHTSTLAEWAKNGPSTDARVTTAVETAMLDDRIWNSLSYETQVRLMTLGGAQINGTQVRPVLDADGKFIGASHSPQDIASYVASLRGGGATPTTAGTGGGSPAPGGGTTATTTPTTVPAPHSPFPSPAPGTPGAPASPWNPPGSTPPPIAPGTVINVNNTTNNSTTTTSTSTTNNTTTPHDTTDLPRSATGGRQFNQTEGGLIIPRGGDDRPSPPTNFNPPTPGGGE